MSTTKKDQYSQLDIFSQKEEPKPKGNITIFKSSAGSGKTFALVKEILKILLMDPAQYQHILAVTFTNEATRKMKSTIIENLIEIADNKETEILEALDEEIGYMGIPYQVRAEKALNNILHNYSKFEVSTIDHFFSQIIRSLAWELNLSITYEIDVDTLKALEDSIERVYGDLLENDEVRGWLEDFAFSKLEEDKGWNIDYNIKELGLQLFEEKYHLNRPEMEIDIQSLTALVDQLRETRNIYQSSQKELARKALKLVRQSSLEWSDFKGGRNSVIRNFDKILKGNFEITKTFLDLAGGYADWYSQTSIKKLEIKAIVNEGLGEISKQIYTNHQQLFSNYNTSISLLSNIYSYGLLDLLDKKLSEYKKENNLVLLSDTSIILSNINDFDVPFIYEKVGTKFNHFLIDEFQDTSDFQWKNFKPLLLNAASENNKIFIAGDVKQSIYRWRGGNMQLLIKGVQETFKNFETQINETKLEKNWRSAKNIVAFNNAFFSMAFQEMGCHPQLEGSNELLALAYQEISQIAQKEHHGYVQIKFLDKVDEGWDSWRENAKTQVATTISECLKSGYEFKDIMILVDAGWQANELSDFLSKDQIPSVTDSSLLVENSPLVRLIISTLGWIYDTTDEVAYVNMVHQTHVINGTEKELINEYFIRNEFQDHLPKDFFKVIERISGKPVYELVEEIIILFDLNKKADIFLNRFQDITLEQSGRGLETISDFLDWWNDRLRRKDKNQELSVIMPADSNAVRIMTIHKAKGLEAPVVIVPFAGSKFELKTRKNTTFWVNDLPESLKKYGALPINFLDRLQDSDFSDAYKNELLEGMIERLNVVYVAFTRPKDRLYVFSYNSKNRDYDKGIENLQKLLTRILEDPIFTFHTNWNESNAEFTLGEPLPVENKEIGENYDHIDKYPATHYQEKVGIGKNTQKYFLLSEHEKAKKVKEGIQIHSILERLTHPSALDRIIQELISEGIISNTEEKNIKVIMQKLLQNEQVNSWFSSDWEVMNEREIIGKGKIFKPDRVLVKDDSAIIIDYKREKKDKKHETQINKYAELLLEIGVKSIEKYLVYITDFEIVKVA